jgi:hypothetical protein
LENPKENPDGLVEGDIVLRSNLFGINIGIVAKIENTFTKHNTAIHENSPNIYIVFPKFEKGKLRSISSCEVDKFKKDSNFKIVSSYSELNIDKKKTAERATHLWNKYPETKVNLLDFKDEYEFIYYCCKGEPCPRSISYKHLIVGVSLFIAFCIFCIRF